jgi:putative membrane protein
VADPDIRFTLANERTFLAWVRTAIGLVAAGVAVFRLLDASAATTVLTAVLLAAGALAGCVGYLHFRGADRAIRRGDTMPTGTITVTVMTAAVLIAAVAAAVSVLVS